MRSTSQITHPAQERLATPTGSMSYTLSEQWCFFFFFLRPQFSSLSLKSRKSNFFADVFTKAALSSQLLKDPECWSSRGLNPRSPNWANQAVVKSTEILLLPFTFNHSELTDLLDFKNTWHFEESPINLCYQFKLLGSGKIQVSRMKMINNQFTDKLSI